MLKFKVTRKKGDSVSREKEELEQDGDHGEPQGRKESTSCGESVVSKDSDLGSLSTDNDMPMLSPGNDVTVTSDCGRSLRSDQSSVYSGGFEKKADSFEELEQDGDHGEPQGRKESTSCGESVVSKDSDLGSLSTDNDMPMLSPGNDVTVTSDCGRSLRSDQSSVYSGGFEKKADSFEDSTYMIESSQSSSSGVASDEHQHDSHSFSSHGNQESGHEDNDEFFHQCRRHLTSQGSDGIAAFSRCKNGRLPIPRRGKAGQTDQEYSSKMVDSHHPQSSSHDLSHDSSSGVESGEAHNLSDSSPNASLKGGEKPYTGASSGKLEHLHNNMERAAMLHAESRYPLHQRDTSWSSFTDSDIRGGSVFSSSDTDNNLPPHQKQLALAAMARKTPILHKPPKSSKNKIATPSSSQALKCKKHVTFKSPALGENHHTTKRLAKQENGHFRDSNILYYEDDGEQIVSDQYYRQVYQETDLDNPSMGPVLVSHSYHNNNKLKGHTALPGQPVLNGHGPSVAKHSQGFPSGTQVLTEAHVHHPQEVDPHSEVTGSWGDHQCSHGRPCVCNQESPDTASQSSGQPSKPVLPIKTKTKVLKGQDSATLSHFGLLPDDVIVRIFSHLPSDQLCQCSAVCRQWYALSWEPSLWTSVQINNPAINIDRALKHLTRRLSYDTPGVCVMVEKINLNGCSELTDRGLYHIAKKCVELRQLEVQGCSNITNIAMFELVSRCVNLEHLNVSGCDQITCISLTPQATVQAQTYGKQMDLRYLDMSECYHLDDSGLQIIASYCTQLVYLYLRRCVKITDIGVQYVANYCNNIKELSVCDCRKVSDFGMKELAKLGTNLRYLSVAKCDNITDVGVKHLAKHCRRIRYLNLRGCEGVSDESIECVAKNCLRLRSLDIGKCDVTDEGLHRLADHSTQLRKLSLKSCDAVTDKGVVYVAEKCRQLQQLNIQECHLTVHAYRTVKKLCKRCIIEHTNPGFY